MPSTWINNLLHKVDPDLSDQIDFDAVTCEYQRDIITDVDWTIVALRETTLFGQPAAVFTVRDNLTNSFYDCVIPKQSYPKQIKSPELLIDQHIVGVNALFEFTNDETQQPMILIKYIRIIIDGSKKANPHMTVDSYEHNTLFGDDGGYVESDIISIPNETRDAFMHPSRREPKSQARPRRSREAFKPGSIVSQASGVRIHWIDDSVS